MSAPGRAVARGRAAGLAIVAAVATAGALSACGTTGSAAPRRPPIAVSLSLERHRATAGTPIRGVATITNRTSKAITVRSCASDGWLDVGLSNASIHFEPASASVACPPTVHLAPGATRFPVTVSTTYLACTLDRRADDLAHGEPACAPTGPPALPAGRYVASVVVSGLPAGTSPAAPTRVTLLPPVGVAWSDEVFADAALPPGARATSVAVPTLRTWSQTLPGQLDVHRLYLVPGTRASVAAYLLHHLPEGASNNQGITIQTDPVAYDAEFIPLTMPAAGPDEDQATLLYAFAADGPGTEELRIDAETLSQPSRPASDKVAPTGRVVVTGYGETSLSDGSTEPIPVTLSGARARELRAVFDQLGLGVSAGCMEFESPYTIEFFDHGARSATSTATAISCVGDNLNVATGRTTGYGLADPHCRLLAAVVGVLPARAAPATRAALAQCRATYVG